MSLVFNMPMAYKPRIQALPGVKTVSTSNWFGGIYHDMKDFFPSFAVEAEDYFKIYPEYSIPPDVERAQSSFGGTDNKAGVNNPLLWKYSRQLTPKLKEFLKKESPEFTNLGDLILVERLPGYLKDRSVFDFAGSG